MSADRGASPVRVLVVDDYKEFRKLVCLILGKSQKLQVVGEASDGSEAVSKAVELKPDLILLDIDLPKLSGIDAARQIRERAPDSKIIFMSGESRAGLGRAALANTSAWGYVLKLKAGGDLLAAVEAVLLNRQFVSKELSAHNDTDAPDVQVPEHEDAFPKLALRKGGSTRSHEAEFHSDEESLLIGFTCFVEVALKAGNPAIVIATESHRKSLLQRLQERGVDAAAAIEQGRYIPVDVFEALSTFMVNELPDPARFFRVAGDLVAAAARAAKEDHPCVAACGEGAHFLWAEGKADAAIQLEHLWDEMAETRNVDTLCGYVLKNFQREQERHIYQRICAVHSAVRLRNSDSGRGTMLLELLPAVGICDAIGLVPSQGNRQCLRLRSGDVQSWTLLVVIVK
jgi:DNA-binding NarL/FixJ family response regulator